jgi:hypothetical protein
MFSRQLIDEFCALVIRQRFHRHLPDLVVSQPTLQLRVRLELIAAGSGDEIARAALLQSLEMFCKRFELLAGGLLGEVIDTKERAQAAIQLAHATGPIVQFRIGTSANWG